MLIEYCHKNLSPKNCQESLDNYKKKFEKEDFDLFLYDYYRKKGINYIFFFGLKQTKFNKKVFF